MLSVHHAHRTTAVHSALALLSSPLPPITQPNMTAPVEVKALACSEEAAYQNLRVFAAWYVLCVCLCAMQCVLLSVKPWHVVRRQCTKTCVSLLRGTCSVCVYVRVCVCNAVCYAFSKALACSEEAVYQNLRVFCCMVCALCMCITVFFA